MAKKAKKSEAEIESYQHEAAKRVLIPSQENQGLVPDEDKAVKILRYRRNPDLDPQLVWRGKDAEDDGPLEVPAPPIYRQEHIHPRQLIENLKRETQKRRGNEPGAQIDFFHDFNGLDPESRTEFYAHDANWQNRMILGDSLLVMGSLAEREGLRGKVQCIYFDPPYGIKFNSNWQPTTNDRRVEDDSSSVSREPEVVRAFRDTWKDGVHSYLTYLRDRLQVARDLLHDRGSIFVQISDENVHRVRALMDEVFGPECFIVSIVVKKKGSQIGNTLEAVNDYVLWYGKSPKASGLVQANSLFSIVEDEELFDEYNGVELDNGERVRITDLEKRDSQPYRENFDSFRSRYPNAKLFSLNPLKSGGFRKNQSIDFDFQGRIFPIGNNQCWKHTVKEEDESTPGMERLARADRLFPLDRDVRFVRYAPTPPIKRISNWWDNLGGASSPIYVVQTNVELVKRCILMTTRPGDLVLDPTCGSGTTAYAAEQWGRRWIVIDTSRVALTLTRARMMSANYDFYLLADSADGAAQLSKEMGAAVSAGPFTNDLRHGFVYVRARWNTSGSIANNAEIDVIWERYKQKLEPLRSSLNTLLGEAWGEWQVPREADPKWPQQAQADHAEWWRLRRERQKEIDASIARNADVEILYDRPYKAKGVVRVAGPFTVESLSPHRVLPLGEDPYLAELLAADDQDTSEPSESEIASADASNDFANVVYENLKASGVQNTRKGEAIQFEWLKPRASRSGLVPF